MCWYFRRIVCKAFCSRIVPRRHLWGSFRHLGVLSLGDFAPGAVEVVTRHGVLKVRGIGTRGRILDQLGVFEGWFLVLP